MVLAYNVDIKGLKELQDKFKKMPENFKKEIRMALQSSVADFVRFAQRDAPTSKTIVPGTNGTFGSHLKGQITWKKINDLAYEVVSGAKYSAYLEWGTITRVSVPAELATYAMQFKGQGLRKTGGIYPQPYFFRQIPLIKKQLENDIKDIASRL